MSQEQKKKIKKYLKYSKFNETIYLLNCEPDDGINLTTNNVFILKRHLTVKVKIDDYFNHRKIPTD